MNIQNDRDTNGSKIHIAARWFLEHGRSRRRGVIPTLRNKFGLSNSQAIEALIAARSMERNSPDQGEAIPK